MKEATQVELGGKLVSVQVYRCDCGCGELIDPGAEPLVVVQSSATLVHTDGRRETVHSNTEEAGKVSYFRAGCFQAKADPAEAARCKSAIAVREKPSAALETKRVR